MDIRSVSFGSISNIKTSKTSKKSSQKFQVSEDSLTIKGAGSPSPAPPLFFSEDDTKRKKRKAVIKGVSLLKELDDLRVALLGGNITITNLKNIEMLLGIKDQEDLPENLKALLLEIETRAAVELEKINTITQH